MGKIEYYCSPTCLSTQSQMSELAGIESSTSRDKVTQPTLKIRSLDELNEGGIIVDIDDENPAKSKEVSSLPETASCVSEDILKILEDLQSRLYPPMVSRGQDTKVDTTSSASQFDKTLNTHHREVQTDNQGNFLQGIPVPFPVYIPSPTLLYSGFSPSPLVIPIPVPIPIPIPLLKQADEDQPLSDQGVECDGETPRTDDEGESLDDSLAEVVSLCGLSDLIPVDEVLIDDSSLTATGDQHILIDVSTETRLSQESTTLDIRIPPEGSIAVNETRLENEFSKNKTQDESMHPCEVLSTNMISKSSVLPNDFIVMGLSKDQMQTENSPAREVTEGQTHGEDSRVSKVSEEPTRAAEKLPASKMATKDVEVSGPSKDQNRGESFSKDQSQDKYSLCGTLQEALSHDSQTNTPANNKTQDYRSNEKCVQSRTPMEALTSKNSEEQNRSTDSVVDILPASRHSLIDEDDLTSETTTLNVETGRSMWNEFVSTKKNDKIFAKKVTQSSSNFATMSNSDRNEYLIAFTSELVGGNKYHPNIIIYTLLCIQKFISQTTSIDSIFLNIFFQRFGKIFYNFLQNYFNKFPRILTYLESTRLHSGLRIREDMLWESFQLGCWSPSVVLFSVMYFNTKFLKLATVEEHEQFAFKRMHKFNNARYLKDGTPVVTRSLRYMSSSDFEKKIRREIFEEHTDRRRCPLKIFHCFTSKCPAEGSLSGNFYLSPILGCCPESKIWFSSRKLPSSTIRNMLNLILMVDEVQQELHDFLEDSVVIIEEKINCT